MSNEEILTKIATEIGEVKGIVSRNTSLIDDLSSKVDGICTKVDKVDLGLNNHLATHDQAIKRFWYPIAVALVLAGIFYLLKVIFHVI